MPIVNPPDQEPNLTKPPGRALRNPVRRLPICRTVEANPQHHETAETWQTHDWIEQHLNDGFSRFQSLTLHKSRTAAVIDTCCLAVGGSAAANLGQRVESQMRHGEG